MIIATAKNVKEYLIDTLGDWEIIVEYGGVLSMEEEAKSIIEYAEIQEKLR